MKRTLALAAGSAVAGIAMIMTALAGTGRAAESASQASPFVLIPPQPDAFTGHNAAVRWAPCITTSSGTSTHVIHYRVAAGLNGKAKAQLAGGGIPQGSFTVKVSGVDTTQTMNSPYALRPHDSWIVAHETPGGGRGVTVLAPSGLTT